MSRLPEDSAPDATGPPDRQTLHLLERTLASDSLVDGTVLEPDPHEPSLLRTILDTGQYTESVTAARLDIRWFTGGDFSIHYIEEHDDGARWECRWDRHPNTHSTRLHFHQPPNATEIVTLEFASIHPLEVYSTVLTAISRRLSVLWSAE